MILWNVGNKFTILVKLVPKEIGDYEVYNGNLLSRKDSYVFFFFI